MGKPPPILFSIQQHVIRADWLSLPGLRIPSEILNERHSSRDQEPVHSRKNPLKQNSAILDQMTACGWWALGSISGPIMFNLRIRQGSNALPKIRALLQASFCITGLRELSDSPVPPLSSSTRDKAPRDPGRSLTSSIQGSILEMSPTTVQNNRVMS